MICIEICAYDSVDLIRRIEHDDGSIIQHINEHIHLCILFSI